MWQVKETSNQYYKMIKGYDNHTKKLVNQGKS